MKKLKSKKRNKFVSKRQVLSRRKEDRRLSDAAIPDIITIVASMLRRAERRGERTVLVPDLISAIGSSRVRNLTMGTNWTASLEAENHILFTHS